MLGLGILDLVQLVRRIVDHVDHIREVLEVVAGNETHHRVDHRLRIRHLLQGRLVVRFRVGRLRHFRLRRLPALRLDQQVTLHFQVQRRAELGAVVRIHAFLVGLELHRHRLARFDRRVRVVRRHREAVRLVLRPLEVGQVNRHFVANFRFDRFRRDVRTDQRAIHRDLVALLLDPLFTRTDRSRVRLVRPAVGADLVAHARLQLRGFDRYHVVRFAQRQRHVVQQLHLVVRDVDQLVVLRVQRTDRVEAVDRQLVQRHQVAALRIDRVAFHRHQVTDVVVHRDLVQHLAFAEVPLGDLAVHVQRRVGDAVLRVVLRVQRAQAELHLRVQRVLHPDHRDAVRVLRFELAGLDRRLDLLEAVHRDVRVELARDDQHLAVRRHVHPVRRLRFRDQEQDAFLDRGFHHQHLVPVDGLRLALRDQFRRLLPVDHVQVVGVLRRAAGFIRRPPLLDAADVALGAERVGERPAVRRALAGVRQILRVRRQFQRERRLRVDPPFLPVKLPVRHAAAVFLVEFFQRVELLVLQRRRVLRGFDHVLGVRRHERAAVFRLEDRVDHDLLRLEVPQVQHRQPRVRLVVDEQELPVVLALRFRNRRVVRVAPGDVLAVNPALRQHRLRFFVKTVALPRFRGEHPDVLQNPHRRNPVHNHLARLAARTEGNEFVALARRHVRLRRRQQVLLVQPSTLQHVLQRLRAPRRTRPQPRRQQRDRRLHSKSTHFRSPKKNCFLPPIAKRAMSWLRQFVAILLFPALRRQVTNPDSPPGRTGGWD